jgi:hypothetical protein
VGPLPLELLEPLSPDDDELDDDELEESDD